MADGKPSNVPFHLNDEDEEDVLTSVDFDRSDAPEIRTSSQLAAISQSSAPNTAPNQAINGEGLPPRPRASTGPQKAAVFPQLTINSHTGTTQAPLSKTPFTVGLQDADLNVNDPFVDRWHAVLRIEDGIVIVEDMGSLNGVFLRIEDDLPLEDRDQIAMGNQRFEFRTTWDPVPVSPKNRGAMPAGGKVPTKGARLIQILEGGLTGHVYSIRDSLSIGCTPNNAAYIDDDSISTLHATIQRSGEGFSIKNVSSAGGTFIRIYDPVELINGDCFLVGTTLISVNYP